MSLALEKYLDRVMIIANRNEAEALKIRAELNDHLLKKIEDLEAEGLKREDAIFQAIEQHGNPRTVGYGLRPRFPWLDVRTKGTARGFIAIGPKAIGVVAIGGISIGVLSYGGFAVGLWSFGLFVAGLLAAIGCLAFSPAGLAFGAIAIGFMGIGLLSISIKGIGLLAVNLIYEPSDAAESLRTIGLFSQHNVPAYIIPILDTWIPVMNMKVFQGSFLSFWISCIVLLTAQLILFRKERRRIKNADPALIE